MERLQMTEEQVLKTMEVVTHHVGLRLQKHGLGAFASKHEAFGVIMEEVIEMGEAIREDELSRFIDEVLDVVVAGVIAVASVVAGAEAGGQKLETPSTQTPDTGVAVERTDAGIRIFDPYEKSLSTKHLSEY